MADGPDAAGQPQTAPPSAAAAVSGCGFLRKFRERLPNSAQLISLLALVVSGGILLFLSGLTFTAAVLGLIFLTPLIIISSPIWVPAGAFLFIVAAGFVAMCGFAVAAVAALSWLYRYFRGLSLPGSDRVHFAGSRIADTASHVIDYARGYGGYLHRKVKDAAPGA